MIKMKFGQILVYLITNLSIMFLVQCWRLETSSRPFHDFNEMAIICQFLVVDINIILLFTIVNLPFLILSYLPFQKKKKKRKKHWKLDTIDY